MNQRLLLSLGLHSAAIIAFQLALMQLISVVQWHHFAYMIISIAMLGFGAGGTLLALYRDKLLRWSEWLVPLLMIISGFCMMLAFHITRHELFRFDAYLLFVDLTQFPLLLANYLIFFLPFFAGALAIGIIFIRHADGIGTWYFSNLVGSGMGGIMFLLVFGHLLPQQIPPMVGMLSVFAGLLCMPHKKSIIHLMAGLPALVLAAVMVFRPSDIPLSEYKDMARTLNLPEAEIIHTQTDLHGLIQVVESPVLRYAPALSLSFTGKVPVKKNVFLRGDFYGVIPLYDPEHANNAIIYNNVPSNNDTLCGSETTYSHILDFTTQALPWVTGPRENVLVLEAATGIALSYALAKEASGIDAVIENRGIVNMMKTRFADESGQLFLHPSIRLHRQEARHFLASAPEKTEKEKSDNPGQVIQKDYDLILLPVQESFGGSAGINALREDYTMTIESFSLMWDRLSENGVIAVTTWLDYPSRSSLKLLASLVETARSKGIRNPEEHIAAIRSWATISFILKKTALTHVEEKRIRSFAHDMSFDPLLLPSIQPDERMIYNHIDDEMLFAYLDQILAGDLEFMAGYGFMIMPATDDKPYFSQFLKLKNLREMSDIFGHGQVPFLELGLLIVVVTLVQSAILALLFIMLPLLRLRKSRRKKTGTLIYFSALGVGYMFVEIILIQRFVLYFGQPVYAISAVISTMLISSGAGSLFSGRLSAAPRNLVIAGTVITLLLVGYAIALTPILQSGISMPLTWKIAISLLIIGIPSFFKGMMFPLGVRFLSVFDASQIPWAWGINGSLSVISTSLATLIAVESGFRLVMMIAVGCYLLATMTFVLHRFSFGGSADKTASPAD